MRDGEIREYAEIMRECGLQRLTVTENGRTICLERPGQTAGAPALSAPVQQPAAEPETAAVQTGERTDSVTSPMVGVFYAAPAENADPFVSVGDEVKAGDTLCIIEAMKLMNEIKAEKSGVVTQVCVTNGQVVEYGTELFRIGGAR